MSAKSKGSKKLSGREQVLAYLDRLDGAVKEVAVEARSIILQANDQLTEHIKWNAPSFCYNGDDRITFNLHKQGILRLVFHCGAKVKDSELKERLLEDSTGLLVWLANDRAMAVLADLRDVEEKRQQLQQLVVQWVEAAETRRA